MSGERDRQASGDSPEERAREARDAASGAQGNREKDPDQWVTGDEPMTGPQASYLETLSREAGEPMDEGLSKADASKRIDELQDRTGRGKS